MRLSLLFFVPHQNMSERGVEDWARSVLWGLTAANTIR